MQTIGPEHEIETAPGGPLERHVDTVAVLPDRADAISEDRFDLAFDRRIEVSGKIAPQDAYEPTFRRGLKELTIDGADHAPSPVDQPTLIDTDAWGSSEGAARPINRLIG